MRIPHPDFLELNSYQISQWQAFGQVYPFGEIREDFRAALVASVIRRSITGEADFSDYVLPEKLTPMDRNARFLQRMRSAAANARSRKT
jgi:hypothetical protein